MTVQSEAMPKPWASFGQDFYLDVDRDHVRASLESALRDALVRGRLTAGSAVPSSRVLGNDLGVARNTVVTVYNQLIAEGLLIARPRSSTLVAGHVSAPRVAPPAVIDSYPVPAPYDLRPGQPDLSSFPRKTWLDAARRGLEAAAADSFGYFEPRGRPEARIALATHLSRTRGLQVSEDQIVICLGAMHGLHLIASALRVRGASVWAGESHSLHVHRDRIRRLGYTMRYLPVDADGAHVERLDDDDAVLLTPAHQFPFGVALSPRRRKEVVRWSRATGGVIVEDDYDGEFRYDRRPVPALQAAAPDRVVYVGTASKTLAPGLRLGWLVVPPGLLDAVLRAKSLSDGHSGFFEELTLAEFISSGNYARHVRSSRLRYQRRRDHLIAALSHVPRLRVVGTAAGLHLLVGLPPSVTEHDVIAAAQKRGLHLEGLARYRSSDEFDAPPSIVIGYGSPPDHAFRECIDRLVATFRECRA